MTDTIENQIVALSESDALEAVGFLAEALNAEETATVESPVMGEPLAHRTELLALAKIALSMAADDEEIAPLVEAALAGVGRKQLVLGGADIALALLSLAAVITAVGARGRRSHHKVVEIERKPDGTEVCRINEKTIYQTPTGVGDVLRQLLKGAAQTGIEAGDNPSADGGATSSATGGEDLIP
jgi:hypothetical protein